MKENLTIIGAGLSGLYAAYLLQEKYNITIIEARSRIGGRILSIDGLDLGPSWVWNHHENILKLIDDLGLELFEQYNSGYALYDERSGTKKFTSPKNDPSFRVQGGMQKIVEKLKDKLKENVTIHLDEILKEIEYKNNKVYIKTSKNEYESKKIIFAIPPRLISQDINFTPKLELHIQDKLNNISTWMAHTSKAVISFEKDFWREKGLSGFTFSNIGPLMEIHDASTKDKAAMIAFFHSKADINNEENIRKQLKRIFPNDHKYLKDIYTKDWRDEKYTAVEKDKDINEQYFSYGYDLSLYDNKVYFIGTEASYKEGGYLEGALISAIDIAKKLL
jgi:monoamine oxidase